eukprot:2361721-Prymnesium_polylepis.1
MMTACVGFAGFPTSWAYLQHFKGRSVSVERLEGFTDRIIGVSILALLVSYPVLSGRLLKIFQCDEYGPHRVLPVDMAMSCDEAEPYYAAASVFVVVHTLGLPIAFWLILWRSVRPLYLQQRALAKYTAGGGNDAHKDAHKAAKKGKNHRETALNKLEKSTAQVVVALQMQQVDVTRQKMMKRYGVLFRRYQDNAWWWELTEIARKVTLVALLTFIADNTTTQIFFALLVSFAATILTVNKSPYTKGSLDFLLATSHTCTTLTLVASLGLKTGIAHEGIVDQTTMTAILVTLQIVPILAVLVVTAYALAPAWRRVVGRRSRWFYLPAAMKDVCPAEEQLRRVGKAGRITVSRVGKRARGGVAGSLSIFIDGAVSSVLGGDLGLDIPDDNEEEDDSAAPAAAKPPPGERGTSCAAVARKNGKADQTSASSENVNDGDESVAAATNQNEASTTRTHTGGTHRAEGSALPLPKTSSALPPPLL